MPNAVALPVHPTTGLTALGVVGGRPVWPVMGGSGDAPVDPAPADPKPVEPKPAEPAPVPDKGFPENTPVADMTAQQQAAYWKHQARRHEDRAKQAPSEAELTELRAAKEERDQLRQAQMTDAEKAVEAARAEGEKTARLALAPDLVAAEFRAQAAGRIPGLDALVEDLNHAKFLTAEGRPDHDAISARVQALIPAEDEQKQDRRGPDLEQGYRNPPNNTPTVSGGADLYAKYKKK